MLMFGICGTLSAQRSPENDKGIQSIDAYGTLFGPMGLETSAPYHIPGIINREFGVSASTTKQTYSIFAGRQEVWGNVVGGSIYNHNRKLSVSIRNYDGIGTFIGIHKKINIWKKKN